jgi:hypothetical protein
MAGKRGWTYLSEDCGVWFLRCPRCIRDDERDQIRDRESVKRSLYGGRTLIADNGDPDASFRQRCERTAPSWKQCRLGVRFYAIESSVRTHQFGQQRLVGRNQIRRQRPERILERDATSDHLLNRRAPGHSIAERHERRAYAVNDRQMRRA